MNRFQTPNPYRSLLLIVILMIAASCTRSEDWYVTAPSGLILRDAASTAGAQKALIPFRERVTVLEKADTVEQIAGKQGPWFRVTHGPHTGWVFSGFLSPSLPGPLPTEGRWGPFEGFDSRPWDQLQDLCSQKGMRFPTSTELRLAVDSGLTASWNHGYYMISDQIGGLPAMRIGPVPAYDQGPVGGINIRCITP